jgi:hypothetical protein
MITSNQILGAAVVNAITAAIIIAVLGHVWGDTGKAIFDQAWWAACGGFNVWLFTRPIKRSATY